MGWHLDGRVTAVFGTHTHVQTADERILPKGTAYLTDAGMTGPHDSIIGVTTELALSRFVTGMPAKFEAATGPGRLNAVIVTADLATGKATAIERLNLSAADVEALRRAAAVACELSAAMADLFSTRRSRTTEAAGLTPGAPPQRRASSPCLLRQRADRRHPRAAREPASARSGSRARSRTARCGTPGTCTSR